MKGTTLLTISDERSFGVQANRAVVRPAGSVSAKMWSLGESALEFDPVQVGQIEAGADLRQHALINEFHRQGKWCRLRRCGGALIRRRNEGRRKDGRAPGERMHAAVAPQRPIGGENLICSEAGIRCAAADEIDERIEIPPDHGEPGRPRRAPAGRRIDEPVGAVDDEDIVVLEVAPQHQGHVAVDPFGGGRTQDVGLRLIGGGEAFQLAQHPLAAIGDGVDEQLFVMRERDFVGAPGRGDDGDHQAQIRPATTRPTGTRALTRARSHMARVRIAASRIPLLPSSVPPRFLSWAGTKIGVIHCETLAAS